MRQNEDISSEITLIDTDKTKEASILCRFQYSKIIRLKSDYYHGI